MSGRDEQLRLLMDRYKAVGVDRRTVLKIAAAATLAGAPAFAPRKSTIMAQEMGGDDVFYSYELVSDPVSFDWNLNLYCGSETEVNAGLLTFDADLNAVADWAESWAPNEDASVWTFNIRKDNKGWTDGTAVTAGDFIWSWARQLAPENGAAYAGFLFDIKNAEKFNTSTANPDGTHTDADGNPVTPEDLGLKAIDDFTLEVTCEGPRAYFPQVVAYQAAVPAPRWEVEKHGADVWASGDVPLVSNGPFKLDNWEHDVLVECSVNENYWNAENINIKKLIVPITPGGTEVLAFEEGKGNQQLDWVSIGADNLERFTTDPELSKEVKKYVYPGIWMLVPSNGKDPFTNDEVGLKVRRSLTHAIDRSRLVTLTKGMVIEAYCMVPIGVYGFLDDAEFAENLKFDKDMALAELVGTPYEGGQNWPPITMHMRGGEEVYNSNLMANDIVAQLKETLGMDIEIQVWPEASWRPELFKNEWQLVWIRWWTDYPDPNNSYGDMYYSKKSSGKRQSWSNEEFDNLVDQGKSVPDPVARLDVYRQAERLIQSEVGYIPVVYRQDTYAFKPWVTNVAVNKQGFTVPLGNIYTRMSSVVKIEGRPAE
ncbi:MAG: ABC transporter substrate-binding protein [Chloroflexota bacterium]